jgi:hypothetical protein
MSNIHVLERVGNNRFRVAFHIAVPGGTNTPGVAWATALTNSGRAGTTVLADGAGTGTDGGIATAEKASIVAGTVYEYVLEVDTQGLSGAALAALVNARYDAAVTEIQAKLQAELGRFGTVL